MKWMFAATALMILPTSVAAHGWYDGWCCNNKDCAPASRVDVNTDGSVTIWQRGLAHSVPKGYPFLPSRDENWHLCVLNGKVRCVYMPAGV